MTDLQEVVGAVHKQMDLSLENAIFGRKLYVLDADIEIFRNNLCHSGEDTGGVNALECELSFERGTTVQAPFGREDAVAKAAFQTHGNGARSLVYDHSIIVVDKSESIVARNRFAAFGNLIVTGEFVLL